MQRIFFILLSAVMLACTTGDKPGSTTGSGTSLTDAGATADAGGADAGAADGGDGDAGTGVADAGTTGPIECALGSIYGDGPTIDPDNPVFSDADYTQSEVEADFAQAKKNDSLAYQAYAFAASADGPILECAFCSCGCADFADHLSAIDCFKDMHGFT